MEKQYFAIRLIPSRSDFAMTMTDEEREIMMQHIAYWKPHLDSGLMLVMGPVMDPSGPYGLGIVEVDSEEQLLPLLQNDPGARINTYEHYPMRALKGSRQ